MRWDTDVGRWYRCTWGIQVHVGGGTDVGGETDVGGGDRCRRARALRMADRLNVAYRVVSFIYQTTMGCRSRSAGFGPADAQMKLASRRA